MDAGLAESQEPAWSPWRDTALYLLGEAHLLADDEVAARAAFSEAAGLAEVNNNADNLILSESELALLAGAAGDWSAAEVHVARALEAVAAHKMQEYLTSVIAFVASARVALHRGDRETATTNVTQAMRARPTSTRRCHTSLFGSACSSRGRSARSATPQRLSTFSRRRTTSSWSDPRLGSWSPTLPSCARRSPRADEARRPARRP